MTQVGTTFTGTSSDDSFTGGGGADTFDFKTAPGGNDIANGAGGIDAAEFAGNEEDANGSNWTADGGTVTIGTETLVFHNIELAQFNDGTVIVGTGGNDSLSYIAGSNANGFVSGDGDDTITPGPGTFFIDAGNGTDTVVIAGSGEDYDGVFSDNGVEVTGDGNDYTLSDVEIVKFDDTTLAIGTDGNDVMGPVAGVNVYAPGPGDDIVTPGAGTYSIMGDDGFDTVVLAGNLGAWKLSYDGDNNPVLSKPGSVITLQDVEKVQFDDIAAFVNTTGTTNGTAGNDAFITGNQGGMFFGNSGNDVALFAGNRSLYNIVFAPNSNSPATITLISNNTIYQLNSVEYAQFDDQVVQVNGLAYTGTGGNDTQTGTGQGDQFNYGQGGNDTLSGGGGNDTFAMGAALTAADVIDGGPGTGDVVAIAGDYSNVPLVLGATTIVNVENLNYSLGSFNYNITTNDANVAAGQTLNVNAQFPANTPFTTSLRFDGSAETDGNFIINGAPGNDVLIGGAGNDTFNLFLNNYNVSGGGGGNWGNDSVSGGAGNDVANFLGGFTAGDSFDGGAGSDTLNLNGNYSTLLTITGAMLSNVEILTAVAGNNYNLAVDNSFAAPAGFTVNGGALGSGNSLAFDGSASSVAFNLTGGAGNDTLTGGSGNDTIATGGGNDTVHAGAGNDFINALGSFGPGDVIDGGAGNDSLNLSGNYSTLLTITGAMLSNVESLFVSSGNSYNLAVDNTFAAPTGFAVNGSTLGSGNTLSFDGSASSVAFNIMGGAGNDTLKGGSGNDFFNGGNGNDTIDGGAGSDTAFYTGTQSQYTITNNGGGNFTIAGPNGSDTLSNVEFAQFADGSVTLIPGTPGGNFTGTSGNDTQAGDNNDNFFDYSQGGNDTLTGLAGNDIFNMGAAFAAGDSIDGGIGADTLNLSGDYSTLLTITSAMLSNVENLTVGIGNNYNLAVDNTFLASPGFNVNGNALGSGNSLSFDGSASSVTFNLMGGAGNDTLKGGSGNDSINIGGGNDTVIAGAGNDFINAFGNFAAGDLIDGGAGTDTLSLNGNYSSQLTITNAMLSNVEIISLAGGNSYNLKVDNTVIAAGGLSIGAGALGGLNSLTFDGTAATTQNFIVTDGAGNDVISTGGGADSISIANGGNDTVHAGGGNDVINAGAAFNTSDVIDGGSGTDTLNLSGNYSSQLIITSAMLSNVEIVNLAGGNNYNLKVDGTVTASGGLSIGAGGLGSGNTLSFDGTAATTQNFIVTDGAGNDVISTGGGADTINISNGGNDTVHAGSGNDTINAGAAFNTSDVVDGGDGNDTLNLAGDYSSQLTITSGMLANVQTVSVGAGFNYNLKLSSGLQTTTFIASTLGSANGLVLDASASNSFVNVTGGAGNDTITGTVNNDTFTMSQGGNDTVSGGSGDDTFNFGNALTAADSIDGGSGGETNGDTVVLNGNYVNLTFGATTMINVEHLNLTFGAGNSYNLTLNAATVAAGQRMGINGMGAGGPPPMNIDGSAAVGGLGISAIAGTDNIIGGGGNDLFTIVSASGNNEVINGGGGRNRLGFGLGNSVSSGVTVDLTQQGSAQNIGIGSVTLSNIQDVAGTGFGDTLTGDGNANVLDGNGGNDIINGGGGDDLISIGGLDANGFTASNAVADGGSGNDTLNFYNAPQQIMHPPGPTTVTLNSGITFDLSNTGAQNTELGQITATNFENLQGTKFDDTLTGDSGNNIIYGGDGDDTLSGGDGNDTIYGDKYLSTNSSASAANGFDLAPTLTDAANPGDDELRGGAGDDYLDGGAGNNVAFYDDATGNVTVSLAISGPQAVGGGDGTDTLVNIQNLGGSAYNDTLTGDGNDNVLVGEQGDDTLIGGAGNDTLYGGNYVQQPADSVAGHDLLIGGAGDDTLIGTNFAGSTAVASYADASSAVTVSLAVSGAQAVGGGDGNDTLTYITGLIGSNYNDTLTGDGNNNTLTGGGGNDTLDGGAGTDTAVYSGNLSQYTVTIGASNVTIAGPDGTDTLTNVEFAQFADQTISLTSTSTTYTGTSGNDTQAGDNGNNTFNYSQGGNDTLTGGTGNDTFNMGAALTSADKIDGGAGSDTVALNGDYSAGVTLSATTLLNIETISLAAGNSYKLTSNNATVAASQNLTVDGSALGAGDSLTFNGMAETDGTFTLTGGAGADVLTGGTGNDTLNGGGGADTLDISKGGNDIVNAGDGNDTIVATSALTAADAIDGGAGTDTVTLKATTVVLGATTLLNVEDLSLAGSGTFNITSNDATVASGQSLTVDGSALTSGSFTFNGAAETDGSFVFDSAANLTDKLTGGAGNDTFNMGAGLTATDKLDGGAGNDTVTLNGDYSAGVTLGTMTLLNIETISLAAGHSYNLITNNATVAAGQNLTVDGSALGAGDVLTFNGAAETNGTFILTGGAGNDVLTGGKGNDTIDGGAGSDTVIYSGNQANYTITPGSGNVVISGAQGTDTLTNVEFAQFADGTVSLAGAGSLTGTSGNDTLTGTSGSDTFDFKTAPGGTDSADGLGGTDTVIFAGNQDDASANWIADGATVTIGTETATLHNIELVQFGDGTLILGTGGNDSLSYIAGSNANGFVSGDGDDTITPGAGTFFIDAGHGTDTVILSGSEEDYDGVFGDNGIEVTGDGNDYTLSHVEIVKFDDATLALGTGGDDVMGPVAGVTAYAPGPGDDVVTPGTGTYTVMGDDGFDTVVLAGNLADWTLSYDGDNDPVLSKSGSVITLEDVEKVQFDDVAALVNTTGTVNGTTGNDAFITGPNGGIVNGNSGNDIAVFAGNRSLYNIVTATNANSPATVTLISDNSIVYQLNSVEYAQFADQTVQVNGLTYAGTAGNDSQTGTGLGDQFNYGQGGNDTLSGGAGNDTFNMGTALTAADSIDGGTGSDTVVIAGNYSNLVLGASTLVNVETLVLAWGGASPNSFSYNVTTDDATVAAGQTLLVAAGVTNPSIVQNSSVIFDGSAETDGNFIINGAPGNDTLKGGAGNDVFNLTVANYTQNAGNWGNDTVIGGAGNDTANFGNGFTAGDSFDGGAGTDTLNLNGDYSTLLTITGAMLSNVETLGLLDGNSYNLAVDGTYAAAAGFTVNGGGLNLGSLSFDGSASSVAFTLNGGTVSDTLKGGSGNDTFNIKAKDTVEAGGGNDVINAANSFSTFDAIDGGTGNDTLNLAGDYSSQLSITNAILSNVETISLGAGFSYNLQFGSGYSQASTTSVNGGALGSGNTLTVDASGSSSAFTLTGGAGSDVLTGGAGDDTLTGGAGNDTLDGGAGTDTAVYSGNLSQYTVTIGASNVTIAGPDGSDTLTHVEFAQFADQTISLTGTTYTGTAGNDTQAGSNGNNIFNYGQGGADTLTGGTGNDTFNMGGALTAADKIDGGAGNDTVTLNGNYSAGVTFSGATLLNIETISLAAGNSYKLTSNTATVAAGQNLTVDGSALGAGDSLTFNGAAETDGTFTLTGGAGADVLTGGAGNDTLTGGGGADTLDISHGGNDIANAGDGNDTIAAGTGLTAADAIDGGAGNDTVTLKATTVVLGDTTLLNVETMSLTGAGTFNITSNDATVAAGQSLTVDGSAVTSGSFTFNGAAETDGSFVFDSAANLTDKLTGGAGNDTFNMGAGLAATDKIDGGAGNDTVTLNGDYSAGLTFNGTTLLRVETISLAAGHSYNLTSNNATVAAGQNLTVDGSALGAGDVLTFNGAAENDGTLTLTGGAGNDTLTGGAGNDTLTGGGGNDTLNGGAGTDTAVYSGNRSQYTFTDNGGGNFTVAGPDGSDTLTNVEFVQFADQTVALTNPVYTGTAGNDIQTGTNGIDIFNYGQGGDDTLNGLDGNDTFNMGTALSAGDAIDGGAGNDTLTMMATTVVLGATTLLNVETISLTGGGIFSIISNDATVAAGLSLTVDASGMASGTVTFNGAAETDGSFVFDSAPGVTDHLTGGAGNDTFNIGAGLTASDKIDGGGGADTLNLNGDYGAGVTLGTTTLLNVETISLATGHSYKLTSNNATVAAGQTLTVDGSALGLGNSLTFNGAAEMDGTLILTGGAGNDTLTGGTGNDTLTGGAGNDTLDISHGGSDIVTAGDGDDTIVAGAGLSAGDAIDGGAGNNTLTMTAGTVVLGATTLLNVQTISLTGHATVNVTSNDATVASGQSLTINGSALTSGSSFTFNGAAETDGSFVFDSATGVTDKLTGGTGNDTFNMGAGLTATDKIDGGAGNDTVNLAGDYSGGLVLGTTTLLRVETLNLAAGNSYSLTSNNATVASGQSLTVNGSGLGAGDSLNFYGSAETDGSFVLTGGAGNDILQGGKKGDTLTGGAGSDTYLYTSATQSLGVNYDTVVGFDATADFFAMATTVNAVDAPVTSGALSQATFTSNLTSALAGHLAANDAVLFTASSGDMAGQTFLIVDANGTAGYQASADYVIKLQSASNLNSFSLANFTAVTA